MAADDGWEQLFNGKDLTNWMVHPKTNVVAFEEVKAVEVDGKKMSWIGIEKAGKDGKPGKTVTLWRVENGEIIGGGPMSHLYHNAAKWTDFHLRAEVKINDKGNSGIFVRAKYNGGIPEGYEAQINATHGDPVKTASIYPNGAFGLDKFKKDTCVMNKAPHEANKFFVYEIIAKGPTLTTIVDGKEIIKWTDPRPETITDPADQKDLLKKVRFSKGHIVLQGHDPGSIMTFKKVEIKELK